jgi:hypothetical protein
MQTVEIYFSYIFQSLTYNGTMLAPQTISSAVVECISQAAEKRN